MPDIALRYELSFKDYVSAQLFHAKRSLWPRFLFFIAWWIYPLVDLFFIASAFLMWRGHASATSIGGAFGLGVIMGCWRFYVRRNYKKRYRQTRCGEGDSELLFTENFIFSEKRDIAKSEFSWKSAKSWRENATVLLIYVAPALFIIVPKRTISESQLHDLRELLRRKVNPIVA
jgi:hypothetical protein